jgi:HD-GYP domain-containing protein (c-di-GMP phosphodiesterase class II)
MDTINSYCNDNDIVLKNTSEIVEVILRTLGKIDRRLIDHGERVAYIAAIICKECKNKSDFDIPKLLILCILHDIGAYKTNEIDDMFRFETEAYFDHALYGYLFLKNTSHLSEYAEAILYHHTDYSSAIMRKYRLANYAQIIHLADRFDILMNSRNKEISVIRRQAGINFSPDYVDALFTAEVKYNLSQKIITGEYKQETDELIKTIEIDFCEVMEYLKILVYAMDFRSPYTVTHTVDTTIISLETGKLLGLSENDLRVLYIGAFLHDIGKIAIPYSILEKPDKLTRDEFEIIKRHIPEGENILRGVVSDEICDIALRHHEKLDGSGYSKGLKADELTLPQRILAVADILSALSQRRSYKEPFSKERVISLLTNMKNSGQLCPLVIDTVCKNYDLLLENIERSHDPIKILYKNLIHEYTDRIAELHSPSIL